MKKILLFLFCLVLISCEEEEEGYVEPGSGTCSLGAQLRVTANTTSTGYDCLQEFDNSQLTVKVYTPSGDLFYEDIKTLNNYSSDSESYEIDFTISCIELTGEWLVEYYDSYNNLVEDDTTRFTDSTIQFGSTKRSYTSISRSDAGC
jgi:hypothetical protein